MQATPLFRQLQFVQKHLVARIVANAVEPRIHFHLHLSTRDLNRFEIGDDGLHLLLVQILDDPVHAGCDAQGGLNRLHLLE